MTRKIDVAILGATGAVGQKFIELLERHPLFQVSELAASEKSQGKKFSDACTWLCERGEMPTKVRDMIVKQLSPESINSRLVFSALPSDVAKVVEEKFARAGKIVVSKASAFRMQDDVPLIIPEINPEHLELIKIQRKKRGWKGCIVTDPNCTTVGLTIVLKPILENFGIDEIIVTTMQALSGAGFPGVPSLKILGNVIPFIENEEDKVEDEPLKILGTLKNGKIENAKFKIFSTCTRVPVLDGHTISLHVKTNKEVSAKKVKDVLSKFKGLPQKLKLPSAPRQPILIREENDRPQPVLDKNAGDGMSIVVGRIRTFENRISLVLLSHNTIRGAAGAGILDAELLLQSNLI